MDIKHVLSRQPAPAGVRRHAASRRRAPDPLGWVDVEGGLVEIGSRRRRASASTTSAAPPAVARAVPARRPARDQRRVARVHGRRRLRAPRAVALRRLGAGAAPRAGRRRSTGREATACGSSTRWAAPARSTRRSRCATSATTRPTPTPVGRHAAAHRGRVGARRRRRRAGRAPSTARQPRRHRDVPPARGRPDRPVACARSTATAGSGRARPTSPTPASTRRPAPSASTTASSCPTRWCCAAAARSRRPATSAPTYRNFFPPGSRWALSGVRLADGGASAR